MAESVSDSAGITVPVLRSRPFILFMLLRAGSASANQILSVALGYQMYVLTGSARDLGFIGLVQFLPALLLALPAGQVVDRYRRRTVLRLFIAIDVLNALMLLAVCFAGGGSVAALYLSAAITGVTRAFEMPANQALLPSLIPRDQFSRAVSVSSSVFQTTMLVAPGVGGLLYEFGPAAAFGAVLALYLVALAAVMAMPAAARIASEPPSLRTMLAGFVYIWQRQEILGAISLDLFGVLLGGATALLPIFARDILHVGVFEFGLLRGAPAVGGLVVAALLARYPIKRRAGRLMFLAVVGFGLATCGFGLATSFPVALLMLALTGAADVVSVNVRLSLVQLRTPDAMRGRVASVNSIFIGTSNQLGEFESGITAYYLGAVNSVLLGGLGTLVVVGIGYFLFPALRRVDRLDDGAA